MLLCDRIFFKKKYFLHYCKVILSAVFQRRNFCKLWSVHKACETEKRPDRSRRTVASLETVSKETECNLQVSRKYNRSFREFFVVVLFF